MKHLKIFEDFKSDKFEEISNSEYEISTIGANSVFGPRGGIDNVVVDFIKENWVPFTKSQINEVTKILGNVEVYSVEPQTSRSEINPIIINPVPLGSRLDCKDLDITIIKMVDEWYYVIQDNIRKIHKNSTIKYALRPRLEMPRRYRCDQFDGLLECLKIIKSDQDHFSEEHSVSEAYYNGDDSPYEKVDVGTMFDFIEIRVDDELSTTEISNIIDMLKPFGITKFEDTKIPSDGEVGIYKFDDEWFIYITQGRQIYICDGLHGLNECITKCS